MQGAEDAFTNLQGLKEPWVSGHGCKDDRWLQHVFEGMRNETQCLGRFMFTSLLEYIRERQFSMKDMSRSGIEEIEEQVKEWQPFGARGQLEQQLLLKEVRIGRRSQELPSWTGVVSVPDLSGDLQQALATGPSSPPIHYAEAPWTYSRWKINKPQPQVQTSYRYCLLPV